MDKKLLQKIKKLLSLANSDNEHEAKLAMDMANELLVKHNISMQQASESLEYEKNKLDEISRKSVEDKFIHVILKNYFFVKIVSSRSRVENKTTIYVLGTDTNVQIATYVYSYLKLTFKSLFSDYKKTTGCKANARQSYYSGLFDGICEQLEKTKRTVEQKEGLVVVDDKALQRYTLGAFKNLKTRSSSYALRDGQAVKEGAKDGKNIRISKGISSNGKAGLFLKS